MKWNEDLPDISHWLPDASHTENLRSGLLLTCQAAQSRIIAEAGIERRFNINNFDSGSGVEDIVRQELSKLLPERYAVDTGVINDKEGKTAGDCDIVIRDSLWAPVVKLGATPESRRVHFPIESIYSVVEIKQTLGFQQLDDAMEKLVKVSGLNRSDNPYGHITENQHLLQLDRDGWILNPLHTTVIGTKIQEGITFKEIAYRFGQINARLSRDKMVTALCVLDRGVAFYEAKGSGSVNATFMQDRDQHLILGIHDHEQDCAFYKFFVHLMGHLNRSVLALRNIADAYGGSWLPYENFDFHSAVYNAHATQRRKPKPESTEGGS